MAAAGVLQHELPHAAAVARRVHPVRAQTQVFGELDGGSAPLSDMNPSTSARSIPASARARVVPWKQSSNAVLSSTRPQSEMEAPTMATRRFGIVRPPGESVAISSVVSEMIMVVPGRAPTVSGAQKPHNSVSTGHDVPARQIDTDRVAGYGRPGTCGPWPTPRSAETQVLRHQTPTHTRRGMTETTENPVGADVIRRIEDGICWITINRPDAGNALTQFMRDRIAEWVHVTRRTSSFAWSSSPEPATAPSAPVRTCAAVRHAAPPEARRRARDRGRRDRSHDHGGLAGSWSRRSSTARSPSSWRERHRRRRRHAPGAGVRPRRDGRGGQVRGGLHPARGIAPDAGGAWLLTRLVGIQKAKELFFFGDDVPAAEAHRIGLANRLVPRGRAAPATLEEMAGPLARAPTKAIWSRQVADQPGARRGPAPPRSTTRRSARSWSPTPTT